MKPLVSLLLLLNLPGQRPAQLPVADLSPGTARYEGRIVTGDQLTPFSVTRIVEDRGTTWLVTETAEMPAGRSTDQTVLEKGTLRVRSRTVRQGQMTMDLTFTSARASGTIVTAASSRSVDVELDGPLFADGAGAHDVLAALPLRAGYVFEYRNFDARAGRVVRHSLKVLGREVVSVPAGSFEAFRIELTSAALGAGVTTLWVATDTHRVVRSSTRLLSPQTREIITELLPAR